MAVANGKSRSLPRLGVVAPWVVAVLVGLILAYRRFAAATSTEQPDFIKYFLPAAAAVVRGELPWSVPGYFYTPLLALMLSDVYKRQP